MQRALWELLIRGPLILFLSLTTQFKSFSCVAYYYAGQNIRD